MLIVLFQNHKISRRYNNKKENTQVLITFPFQHSRLKQDERPISL